MLQELPSASSLLREARRRSGLSQAELARRAGIAQSVVSIYESGRREPSLPTFARLVAATGYELRLELHEPEEPLDRLTGPLGERVRARRHLIKMLAQARGVTHLELFGSVARGRDTLDSDIDLLIDPPPGMGLLRMARLQRELEDVLDARVDLIPDAGLKPAVRERVLADRVRL